MLKMTIRVIEDGLPSITESLEKMSKSEKLRLFSLYHQAKKLLLHTNATIMLDVGCGDGLFLNEIYQILFRTRCTYVGIDISSRKLHLAKRESRVFHSVDAHFVLCDADYLPFKSSTFQTTSMVEVFEHFLDPRATIIELSRVISHDGNVVITTPSASGIIKIMTKSLSVHSDCNRQKFLLINGKKLPHRDFNSDEVLSIINGYFRAITLYSFNFDPILVLARFLPYKLSRMFIIPVIEEHACRFPVYFGSNLAILLQRQ